MFVVLAVVAAMLISSVCAETVMPSASIDGSTINITYAETDAGYGTFIYVFSTRVGENMVISESLMNSNLVYAGVGSSGLASVNVPVEAYGVYTVVLGAKGFSAAKADRTIYILYEEPGIKDEALTAITNTSSASDMINKIQEYNNKAYILELSNVDDYQQELIYELVKAKGVNTTLNQIIESVEFAGEIAEIRNADIKRISEILINNKDVFGVDGDIDSVKNEAAAAVKNRLAGNETATKLKTIIREEVALALLNNAPTSQIIETIYKYNDVFDAQLSSRLSDISEYELEKVLANVVFLNANAVEGIVNKAIDDIYKEQPKIGNNTSTMPRGGGGGYVVPSTLKQSEVEIINEDENKIVELSDLAGYEWAEGYINYIYENAIMTGDGNGSFRPGDNLTREEFTKILITAFGGGKIDEMEIKFTDVEADAWYKPYIATASKLGITAGVTEETFGTGQYITRQDAAVMLQRAADAYYLNFEKKQTLVDFTDYDTVSDYARAAVDTLARAQIINGFEDGSFRPHNNITRAEIAKIIFECIKQ